MPAWIIRLRRFFASFLAGTLLAANGAAAFDYNYEAAEPRFENVSLEAGVEHIYGGSWEYYTGGGVAAFDCDRDGDADLFFAGGANPGETLPHTFPVEEEAPATGTGGPGKREDGDPENSKLNCTNGA